MTLGGGGGDDISEIDMTDGSRPFHGGGGELPRPADPRFFSNFAETALVAGRHVLRLV